MDFVSVSTNDTKYLEIFKKDDFSLSLKSEKKKNGSLHGYHISLLFAASFFFFFFCRQKESRKYEVFRSTPLKWGRLTD